MKLIEELETIISKTEDVELKNKLFAMKTEVMNQRTLKTNITNDLNEANKKIKTFNEAAGNEEMVKLKEIYGENSEKAKIMLDNGLEENQIKAAFNIQVDLKETTPSIAKEDKPVVSNKMTAEKMIAIEVEQRLGQEKSNQDIKTLQETIKQETK